MTKGRVDGLGQNDLPPALKTAPLRLKAMALLRISEEEAMKTVCMCARKTGRASDELRDYCEKAHKEAGPECPMHR